MAMEYDIIDLMAMGVAVVLFAVFDLRLLTRVVMRGQLKRRTVLVIYLSVTSLVCGVLCALCVLSGCGFTLDFCISCVLQGLICGAGAVFAVLLYYDKQG